MNKNASSPLKIWQTMTAILVIGLILSVAGWEWWNGKGPFRAVKATTSPREKVDLLDGVKYVTTEVTSDGFADSGHTYRWNNEGKNIPLYSHSEGEEVLWSPPSLKGLHPTPKQRSRMIPKRGEIKVKRKIDLVKQEINNEITKVVLAGGFRLLPYATPSQTNVSVLSCAHIHARIETYKEGKTVFFRVTSSIDRPIPVPFKKSALVGMTVMIWQSPGYVVPEKEALTAIKKAVRETTEFALKLSRECEVLPGDEKRVLSPNPEEAPTRAALPPLRSAVVR